MSETLARRERHDLCDLALELDDSAATLCGNWTARELMAHLWVREHRPAAALGAFVPRLSFLTDAAMARAGRLDYADLIGRVRDPGLTPFALGPVESLANTLEMVVHHEDLRRGHPGWAPRILDPRDVDDVWRALRRQGRLLVRRVPGPVVVRRTDTDAVITLRGGGEPVEIAGPVVEVVLAIFGRAEVREVRVTGPDDAVAGWHGADHSF